MTYILYNPLANGGHGREGLDTVQTALAAESPQVNDITTLDTASFLRGLSADDRVVLCGGDGTANRLVNDLAGEIPAVPIEVWRFGTGNDFLRDITDNAAAKTAPQAVSLSEHLGNLPVAQAGGRTIRYLNGCSVGVDAMVCHMLNRARANGGNGGYVSLALKAIFREYRPVSGRVTVNGVTHEYEKLWMAASMNGRYQGGGMKFAPEQDRRSKLLTCMVWHGTSPLGTLLHFPAVIGGTHAKYAAYCDFFTGSEISVEVDEAVPLQFDGETIDSVTGYIARK